MGASLLTAQAAAENSTFGCSRPAAAIPSKSQKDLVTIGSRTGQPMENTLPIVPRRAQEGYTSFQRLAGWDWSAGFRRLDIFHAGPRIAPKYCFRLILPR